MDITKDEPRKPVAYITTEKSLVGNEIHEAGARVMYDGLPAENLTPTCDVGRARYQEYLDSNKIRIDAMIAEAKGTDLNKMRDDLMERLAAKQVAATEAQTVQIGAAVAQAVVAALAAFFPDGVPGAAPAAPAPAPAAPAPEDDAAPAKHKK